MFHEAVQTWFDRTFDAPTAPQVDGWKSIQAGKHTLIAAPTGSGKTLAAFLAAIDDLTKQAIAGTLEPGVQIVYVSPLKALSNDVEKNLQQPLRGIREVVEELGLGEIGITSAVRTGDTPPSQRTRMVKNPPHILVTTPESLYILLTSNGGRNMLRTAKTLIVDEIHAVAPNKRGSHLSLTMARLEHLTDAPLTRIGLSATQKPIEDIAAFLTGHDDAGCTIVDVGHKRDLDLQVEVTGSPLQAVMPAEHMEEIYDRLARLVSDHTTTLIFTNTRREAERITRHLAMRIGDEEVTSHHGSLSKERRLRAEQALKSGHLRALVATASLELGIDIGAVDLVCQIGSIRAIGTLMQRVGRASHQVGGVPKGRIFPLTLDELVESVAVVDAIRRGELDALCIPPAPLDILAQQIIAMSACDEWPDDDLFEVVRSAYPYRDLDRTTFDEVLGTIAEGFSTRRGRKGAYIYWDEVNHVVRGRKSARLTALTSGGAIPDRADYKVVMDDSEIIVGSVDEDFAIESTPGDVFQLGNVSWQIMRVESGIGRLRVVDARGAPPSLPFWFGEAPSRTFELSSAVARLREDVSSWLPDGDDAIVEHGDAIGWLCDEVGVTAEAATQTVQYILACRIALGTLPTQQRIVVERFFDEAGNTHLVVHSPFGSRVNRAWGLALRKRFCRAFNFELQAAANEDAIILSMGPTHSFPLDEVFEFLAERTVRNVLIQALLDAPVFETRWRWNLNRALMVPRFWAGKKVPPQIQRMQAEDMLAVVFPDQIACLENIQGEREIPDHPIINQTIYDCVSEAMDIEGLETVLRGIKGGSIETVARDLREPSPLAHQVLNARPYAYLDPAPLEERRTRAVMTRSLDLQAASDLAILDESAIDRVRDQAWVEAETTDELHDALVWTGFLADDEVESGWEPLLTELVDSGRAAAVRLGDALVWAAAERRPQFEAAFPEATFEPDVEVPGRHRDRSYTSEEALVELIRGRLDCLGPTTASALAAPLGVSSDRVEIALLMLENEGAVFRGQFSTRLDGEQWCERRLLARIHRQTLDRLRKEISPVTPADFQRFLLHWQGLYERRSGPEGVAAVLEQLSGFHAAASAWETDILPSRVSNYAPSQLDGLCLSGRFAWGRFRGAASGNRPVRTSPIAIVPRSMLAPLCRGGAGDRELSSKASKVLAALEENGASFYDDLRSETRLLPSQLEEAIAELVAAGVITADSYSGLRALLTSRAHDDRRRRSRRNARSPIQEAGRWSIVRRDEDSEGWSDADVEDFAWLYLRRYGVVFRRLLAREPIVPWRELLWVYRRLEARGEIRGGRFVSGFVGEQYALPEAITMLRRLRREGPDGQLVSISGVDPLNLTGIIGGNTRLSALAGNRVVYRDGVAVAVLDAGTVTWRVELDPIERAEAERVLLRRPTPPSIQAITGHR